MFDKIKLSFVFKIKNSEQIKENFFILIKDIYAKHTLHIILYEKTLREFPLKSETSQRCLFFISIHHCIGGPSQLSKIREMKAWVGDRKNLWKERIKLTSFTYGNLHKELKNYIFHILIYIHNIKHKSRNNKRLYQGG